MSPRHLLFLAAATLLACRAGAQSPPSGTQVPGASVTGVVRDSISGKPLPDAAVQIVAADSSLSFSRVTASDSLGRFTIYGVPEGTYLLGFFHPMLDSLGVEAPLRTVEVVQQRSVHVDLGGPSPETLRIAFC